MKTITLRNSNKLVVVDDEDYRELNKYKWRMNNYGYAIRSLHLGFDSNHKRLQASVLMHRQIMNTPKGLDTDHKDMDKLNNRRDNLRICNRSGNVKNRGQIATNPTGYKCIFRDEGRNRWRVQIGSNGTLHHIGRFKKLSDAIHARDEAVSSIHKEFARC